MAKVKTQFECSACGKVEPKYTGRCSACNTWNSFVEVTKESEKKQTLSSTTRQNFLGTSTPTYTRLQEIDSSEEDRTSTGFVEFDRVLGGGIVPGEMILITGDPGIGKSTLLIQTANNLAQTGPVLYVSGEESPKQLKLRANRLGFTTNDILVLSEIYMDNILTLIREVNPSLVIIDSINTMVAPESTGVAGGTSQVKACTQLFMDLAKTSNIPMIIVGHVTKDGELAGPKNLEHMVDCVLYFEGDKQNQIRILRTVKNRFGATDEVGIFEMLSEGLAEKANPSELFLSDGLEPYAGSATVVTMEGTRPILAEVQALVVPTIYNFPKRMASGIDNNKLTLLCASLERKVGLPLGKYDVYVKTLGGLKMSETTVDLAVSLAIVSSLKDIPLPPKTVVLGEVGMVGEVRKVPHFEKRVKEAVKMGWTNIYAPVQDLNNELEDATLHKVRTIQDAIGSIW